MSFQTKAAELMKTNPDSVRRLARSENKYERVMAEIILETAGEKVN
jgi:hypothetical protein